MTNFSNTVKDFQKEYRKDSGVIFRSIILEVLSRIIQRTPVDTGRLAGNWQAGVNVSPNTINDNASAIAKAVIASATPKDKVILANNLPYARVAEEGLWGTASASKPESKVTSSGFSLKAKKGMVGITVNDFEQIVKEAAAIVGRS